LSPQVLFGGLFSAKSLKNLPKDYSPTAGWNVLASEARRTRVDQVSGSRILLQVGQTKIQRWHVCPAVNLQDLAGEEGARGRRQINHGRRYFLGVRDPV